LANETKSITHTEHFDAPVQEVYDILSNGDAHTRFSGTPSTGEAKPGAEFSFWGGQIVGKHLELAPGKRIVQEWRPANWPEGAPPTRLEFTLAESGGGTDLTMVHSDLPPDTVEHFRTGWNERYWNPMREYFKKK